MITADELLRHARAAAVRAYCRYSEFPVGAAVADAAGKIFLGCNVENASYGLTVCAERVAIFNAVANGSRPVALAVSCSKGDAAMPSTLMPCGACRQVMTEFLPDDAAISVDGVRTFRLVELLPEAFRLM